MNEQTSVKESVDMRHRSEVKQANVAVGQVRLAAKVSAIIGGIAFVWTIIIMATGDMGVSEGVVVLAGTALGTVVPAAGLYAASFRTSLGAARLERSLDAD